jgi:hypothetical protein
MIALAACILSQGAAEILSRVGTSLRTEVKEPQPNAKEIKRRLCPRFRC